MLVRLKDIRKTMGLNQTVFAKHLGLTQTAYSMIESGLRPLSDKYVKVICSEFGISENWFRFGNGEMFSSSPYEKEFLNIYETLSSNSQEYLLTMARDILNAEKKLLTPKNE